MVSRVEVEGNGLSPGLGALGIEATDGMKLISTIQKIIPVALSSDISPSLDYFAGTDSFWYVSMISDRPDQSNERDDDIDTNAVESIAILVSLVKVYYLVWVNRVQLASD